MAKMKALVKRDAGARGLDLLDVEKPEPGATERERSER